MNDHNDTQNEKIKDAISFAIVFFVFRMILLFVLGF